ncbi:MAG: ATP-binding cassette domain-containing protein [Bacteriovoracales bacterium]|nr:ATP-binding cassette domain-containing protein [Bacteriovoracales bacterium]
MPDTILQIQNLNLKYELEFHRSDSVRDIFVGMIKNPLQMLFGDKDVFHIIKDFNLNLKRGERLGIIGVNGTGKTSLCRCIAGMLRPESGEITIKGQMRSIFDTNIGIQPELTGKENAILLARFIFPEAKSDELKEIVRESLEFSELGKFLDMPFKNYSKGMQAKLGLSLITAKPTDLLILDEVFDGADHFFQQKISQRTLEMIEKSGAVIFVSHNFSQLEAVCNRMIVMEKQNILYDGNVLKGIEYYKSLKR